MLSYSVSHVARRLGFAHEAIIKEDLASSISVDSLVTLDERAVGERATSAVRSDRSVRARNDFYRIHFDARV